MPSGIAFPPGPPLAPPSQALVGSHSPTIRNSCKTNRDISSICNFHSQPRTEFFCHHENPTVIRCGMVSETMGEWVANITSEGTKKISPFVLSQAMVSQGWSLPTWYPVTLTSSLAVKADRETVVRRVKFYGRQRWWRKCKEMPGNARKGRECATSTPSF